MKTKRPDRLFVVLRLLHNQVVVLIVFAGFKLFSQNKFCYAEHISQCSHSIHYIIVNVDFSNSIVVNVL